MEPLARQSQTAIDLFSDEWFRLIQKMHKDAPVRYLIVTVERLSGVVYAPVSNLSRDLLGAFSAKYAEGDLIEKIRHEYLLPGALEGPIRDLWAAARADSAVLPPHYLLVRAIRVDDEKGDDGLAVCDPDGKEDVGLAKALMERFAVQLKQTSLWLEQPGLRKLVDASSAKEQASPHPFLLLRLESSFPKSASFRTQRLDLVQLGLALSPHEQLPPDSVEVCLSACRTSGLAAFSVLYEKERYYERAARQCITTSAVKHGPRADIKGQAEVLTTLQDKGAFNIPVLDKARSDPALWKKVQHGGEGSWYRMPWLDLRSLADTLLWKGGSKDFELAALMRATVSHLRQVHWRTSELGMDEHPKEAILGALLLAKRAAMDFYDVARDVVKRVDNESPIFHSAAVRFYRRGELSSINRVLRKVVVRGNLRITLRWHNKLCWRDDVRLPEHNLAQLCKVVANASLGGSCRALQANSVHADAHFGNLLVDASVPEDPLIISIDPKPFKLTEGKVFRGEVKALGIDERLLERSLHNLMFDPLYDLAKCVMSTSGLHGLIIRRALELHLHSTDNKGFTLANPPDGVRHLTDTGGMSSSGLIRVGTQVRKECLIDHDTCSGSLLRELQQALSADSGKPGTDPQSRLGISVGLIRLWGLSLRALFSAASDRFPSDMSTGVALFILASAFAEVGTRQFVSVLKGRSLLEASAADLQDPFRWYKR